MAVLAWQHEVREMLTHDQVLKIQQAALDAQLDRASLLVGISPALVSSLRQASTPAAQLLLDLHELAATGSLVDGTVPLRVWLRNAKHLAGPKREAVVFQHALSFIGPGELSAAVSGAAPSAVAAQVLSTILLLGANPSDTTRIALDREAREIGQRLRSATLRDAFRIEQAWAVRASDLQECLLRYRPTIVHFSGHGNTAGQILLENERGTAEPVSTTALAKLFRILRRNVRCVVLNSCYSETQARVIAEHIDCVVGMSAAIEDNSAIAFAGAFYQALAFGEDVQSAFDLGCNQIDLKGRAHADGPTLLMRAGAHADDIRFATEANVR